MLKKSFFAENNATKDAPPGSLQKFLIFLNRNQAGGLKAHPGRYCARPMNGEPR